MSPWLSILAGELAGIEQAGIDEPVNHAEPQAAATAKPEADDAVIEIQPLGRASRRRSGKLAAPGGKLAVPPFSVDI